MIFYNFFFFFCNKSGSSRSNGVLDRWRDGDEELISVLEI